MLWVLKRTVSMRWFFENPKHMFKLMAKKIITIYWFLEASKMPLVYAKGHKNCCTNSHEHAK